MTHHVPDSVDFDSEEALEHKKAALLRLFPEIRTENGKIDFERLKLLLGEDPDVTNEHYGMNWPGKAECFNTIQAPGTGALLPCRDESVKFDNTDNVIIEGDNLEVLKLLQKSYADKIKMIYIDPPYNTGGDFIYPDNFKQSLQVYLKNTGQTNSRGKRFADPETDGRFHSKWLNMMYPRLYLARRLMREDGVIFISIDANEIKGLRVLGDELFGEDCFIAELIWKKKSGGGGDVGQIVVDHEYIVIYGKTPSATIFNDPEAQVTTSYNKLDPDGRRYSLDRLDKQSLGYHQTLDFPIQGPDGRVYQVVHKDPKHKVARWRWGRQTVANRYDELVFQWPYVYTKNYEKDSGAKPRSLLVDERFGRTRTGKTDLKALFGVALMDHPKPVKLMKHLIKIATKGGDLILDFFAGSGTVAQACLELSSHDGIRRPFIMIQIPESTPEHSPAKKAGFSNIADICKERVRRVIDKFDTSSEEQPTLEPFQPDLGFRVFKLVESNFKILAGEALNENLYGMKQEPKILFSTIHGDRTEEAILYEILLKSGLNLTESIETLTLVGKIVYSIAENKFLICLEKDLNLKLIHAMADMKPERVVCLHGGFEGNDQFKADTVRIFEAAGVKSFEAI